MHPIVATRQGPVRGCATGGVSAFKGIPYAEPPVGAHRLLPPHPVSPWSEVRDALAFGPKFPQPAYPPEIARLLPPEVGGQGDNGLTLNVWTPALAPSVRPVMVWIPGGMFAYHGTSASPWYDGSRFARDGIVCVTINYRVGIDGFLYLGEGNANRGLLDQVAALSWVHDNIAAFGGDPDNVTVFGESAGAMSVGTLLAMPRAEGLFRRAIAQSGGGHHALSIDAAWSIGHRVANDLGVPLSRDAMAAVPLDRLLGAQVALEADLMARPDPVHWGLEVALSAMPWQPVVDGEVLPARPIDRIAAGASDAIDLMMGTNTDEHRLFLATNGMIDSVTPAMLAGLAAAYDLPPAALAAYRGAHPTASPGDLFAAIQTDWFWRIPAIRLADAHAGGRGATYLYELAWRSPAFEGRLGACHALDIPFVFDTLDQGTTTLWGATPPQELADAMHAAWVAFASGGSAGWPAYEVTHRMMMRFDERSRVVSDQYATERAIWEGLR